MARYFAQGSSEYLNTSIPAWAYVPFTFACWFYPIAADTLVMQSVGDSTVANHHTTLRMTAGQAVQATTAAGGWQSATTTTTCTLNTWNHGAAIFYAANSRAALLNGGGKGTSAGVAAPSGPDWCTIGVYAQSFLADYMDGAVGEAVALNIAATDYQVWLHAQGVPAPVVWPGWAIAAYWPLFEVDRDFPIGNYNMTPVNTPSWAPHPPKMLEYWRRYQVRAVATQTTQARIAPWTWVDWSPEGMAPAVGGIPMPIFSDRGIHSAIHGGQIVR